MVKNIVTFMAFVAFSSTLGSVAEAGKKKTEVLLKEWYIEDSKTPAPLGYRIEETPPPRIAKVRLQNRQRIGTGDMGKRKARRDLNKEYK